jgi:hypothetical protein
MSRTAGSEADGGGAGSARNIEHDAPSGPLAIASRSDAQQSNAAQAARNLPVEHIGALTADELEEVTLISDPTARGLSSGAFDKNAGNVDWSVLRKPLSLPPPLPQPSAAVEPARPALEAFYGERPRASERAELRIEDLSLDFTNPFVGSSLHPPPAKQRSWLRPVLISAAASLLVGAGYAGALVNVRDDVQLSLGQPILQPSAAEIQAPQPDLARPAPQPMAAAPVSHAAQPVLVTQAPAPAQPVAARPQAAAPSPAQASAARPVVTRLARPVVSSQAESAVVEQAAVQPVTQPVSSAASADVPTSAPAAVGSVLSRAQVQIGLESVRGALQTCVAGGHGKTMANVTISGAGRVTYAFIEGAFVGTPQGSCMARALRAAQFPPFTSAQLRVRYPFAF